MMSLINKDRHKVGVLTMDKHSGGLVNQLNRIMNCLIDLRAKNISVLMVSGFRADMFE